jgi:colanic acid/amylovoran biosynthesis protein
MRERYYAAVAAAVERLVTARGARVVFISTCQGVPEYGHDDSQVADRVFYALPEAVRPEVEVDSAYHHPAELRALLGQCDAVVATRMHAAILAMLGGAPALAIGYEAKSRELFARAGLADWCLDIAGEDLGRLPDMAVALVDQSARLRAALPAKLAELAGSARANARAVRRVLQARGVLGGTGR